MTSNKSIDKLSQSETEPAGLNFGRKSSNLLDTSLDLDNDVFEAQFSGSDGARHFHKLSYNSPVRPSQSNYDLHISNKSFGSEGCDELTRHRKMIQNIGVALPADIFEFLKVQNVPDEIKPNKQRVSLVYENIHGGAAYLQKLATLEQVKTTFNLLVIDVL